MKNHNVAELNSSPFSRHSWNGKIWALDDTPINDFTLEDFDFCPFIYSTPDDWDGTCAAIFRLKDGRWVAFETTWGPTGHGFSEDAYGGDANIFVAKTCADAGIHGVSENIRKEMGFYELEVTVKYQHLTYDSTK